jgi:chorismate mutase / prephenate dehydratase
MNISYLGPKGTFSELALVTYFNNNSKIIAKSSIEDVFKSIIDLSCKYGIVPVENSIEGAVNNTLDQLLENDIYIVGEITIPIKQCLLSKNKTINKLTKIYSHSQSFAQCRKWISQNIPDAILSPVLSNSEGAISIKKEDDACIGPEILASYYGLNVLADNIQDFKNNETRFLVICKEMIDIKSPSNSKTSIVVTPKSENKSGSLYHLLKPFSENNINLTRIESRPLKVENWQYSFFIDFEGYYDNENIQRTFELIKEDNNDLKLLGSYNSNI